MSPTSFNSVIDILIWRIERLRRTYRIKNIRVGTMVYADDTTVVCKTLRDLQIVTYAIENFCSEYDIKINVTKTKWMRFGPQYNTNDVQISLLGQKVEQVNELKFLGGNDIQRR